MNCGKWFGSMAAVFGSVILKQEDNSSGQHLMSYECPPPPLEVPPTQPRGGKEGDVILWKQKSILLVNRHRGISPSSSGISFSSCTLHDLLKEILCLHINS